MITVLHIVRTFVLLTEHFIYNTVATSTRTVAHVLTEKRENRDQFPFERVNVVPSERPTKFSLWWLGARAYKVFYGGSLRERMIDQLIERCRPKILHAHFGQVGFESLWIKRKYRLPLVTTFYGHDMSVLPRLPEWQKNYAELFSEGDLFLVEGPCMRDKLVRLGAPEEKTEIQRIAIQVDKYPEWSPSHAEPTVLFCARFVEKKGLIYALQAVDRLRHTVKDLKFRIIGAGPEKAAAVQFIRERRMQDCVTLLGTRPHGDILAEFKSAHVLLSPSVTARDGDTEGGAPTAILEAQAVGIPIVSTYHADIPNVVGNGEGIFLSKERDVEGLADNLAKALRWTARVSKDYVAEYHDTRKEVARLEDKYFKRTDRGRDKTECR